MIYNFFDINALDEQTTAKYYPVLSDKKKKLITSLSDAKERCMVFCAEILARQCLHQLTDSPEFSFQLLLDVNGKSAVGNFDAYISLCSEEDILCCAVSKSPLGASLKKADVFSFSQLQRFLTDKELRDVFSFSRFTYSDLIKNGNLSETPVCERAALYLALKQSYFRAMGKVLKNNYLAVDFTIKNEEIKCSDSNVKVSATGFDRKNNIAYAITEVKNE